MDKPKTLLRTIVEPGRTTNVTQTLALNLGSFALNHDWTPDRRFVNFPYDPAPSPDFSASGRNPSASATPSEIKEAFAQLGRLAAQT